jgi:hypothetical protein
VESLQSHCIHTQLFGPGFTLDAGPPSGFKSNIVGCWGEPCGEPAISLHSYTVSLAQWSTRLLPVMRDPGSIPGGHLCETGIILLALSHYKLPHDLRQVMHSLLVLYGWKISHNFFQTKLNTPHLLHVCGKDIIHESRAQVGFQNVMIFLLV